MTYGRPPIQLPPPRQLQKAVTETGSIKKAAALLGVNYRTLERRIKVDPKLRRAYVRGKARFVQLKPHGTLSSYRFRPMPDGTKGCRCAECRGANAAALRANRRSRLSRPIPEHVHGTVSGYINWACKCDRCKKAGSENNKALRARRLARAS